MMPAAIGDAPAMTADALLKMSKPQLDALFGASEAGPIPTGVAHGTALIRPGTLYADWIADGTRIFGWQGKTFDAQRGTLVNRVTPFGVSAIPATVYLAPSWYDGRECVVLDYSTTSFVARDVRDEIRRIAPNLYLGLVFWRHMLTIRFALDFTTK